MPLDSTRSFPARSSTKRTISRRERSTRFRLVVAEDTTAETAVCVPVFVLGTEADDLRTAADAAGGVTVRLRPLDDRDLVEFAVADPDLFFELAAGE